ncbi:MAG: glycosyltransferase family 4 protein, partial [Candidatus Lokiarchaeota archaeon]|nr:glycosyltransferase family 4 protein [Candidatus Lokiarchaeota archaeon]
MINIAMLTPFFTGKLGGPYNVLMELAPILEKKGISTNIFTTSAIRKFGRARTEFYEEKSRNFKIYRFDSYLKFKEYRTSFNLLPFLLKNEEKIDIIHSHALRSFQEDIGLIVSLIKKKPLIISPHGGISINWDYRDKIPKMISDKTVGYLKKYLKPHYIAVTKMEIPIIKEYGADDDHIHFIPHGVNMDIFRPVDGANLKKQLGLENSDIILYVGRIAKGKG